MSARVAVYRNPVEPPRMREVEAPEIGTLIERVFESVAGVSRLPLIAVREVIENLVHAGFANAIVTILDSGAVIRVSDSGPGIPDPDRALEPGFTTAGPAERQVIRGVGSGLPLAASLLTAEGGRLELTDNLGGGTVVTISIPSEPEDLGGDQEEIVDADARMVMALLLELGPSTPDQLAGELGWPVCACGRELVMLEARGFVSRGDGGVRSLTPEGSHLLATLF
ncbi:MAG: ATP-binding protein [Thermoleophilia bacterium]